MSFSKEGRDSINSNQDRKLCYVYRSLSGFPRCIGAAPSKSPEALPAIREHLTLHAMCSKCPRYLEGRK